MALSFLNPWYLLGAAAVALPVIIHLVHRRKTSVIPFGTLMFLRLVDKKLARRHRLREILLLILRSLVILFLVLGVARPVWKKGGAGRAASVSVIIIDDSFSMQAIVDNIPLIKSAQGRALEIVDTFERYDEACVIPASAPVGDPELVLTHNRNVLAGDIEALDATDLSIDLSASLSNAERLLAGKDTGGGREVFIITDMQYVTFEDLSSLPSFEKLAGKCVIYIVDVAGTSDGKNGAPGVTARNVAVTDIALPTVPSALGVPFRIQTLTVNYSPEGATRTISLAVGNETVEEKQITVPPNGRFVSTFIYTPPRTGLFRGEVSISGDGLAVDDKRFFSFEVADKMKVLIVDGSPSSIASKSETYHLKTALSADVTAGAGDAGGSRGAGLFEADIIPVDEFDPAALDEYRVVVLANVASLSQDIVAANEALLALEDYVLSGNGLIFFAGDLASPEVYRSSFADTSRMQGGLFPGTPIGVAGEPGDRTKSFKVTKRIIGHPVFSNLHPTDRNPSLASAQFYRYMQVSVTEDDPLSARLALFDTGYPFLVEKKFGAGKVLLYTSSCDIDWNNFFLKWFGPVVFYRSLFYIADRASPSSTYYVGTPIRRPLARVANTARRKAGVYVPGGGIFPPKIVKDSDAEFLLFEKTFKAGIYEVRVSVADGGGAGRDRVESRYFAYNVDPDESDLTRISRAALEETFTGADAEIVGPGAGLASIIERRRYGMQLWDALFIAAVVALLIESYLSNRIAPLSRRKKKRGAAKKDTLDAAGTIEALLDYPARKPKKR